MTEKSSVFNLSFFRHKTLIHIMDVISTWFDYVVLLYRMHFRFENFSARIACGFFVRWVFHLIAFPNHLLVLLKNPFQNRNDFEWVRLHVDHTTKILHVFECFFFSLAVHSVCVLVRLEKILNFFLQLQKEFLQCSMLKSRILIYASLVLDYLC